MLDFVNSAEDIRAAFAPYYEESTIEQKFGKTIRELMVDYVYKQLVKF